MELEYRVEEGDLHAFLDHHMQHSEAARDIRRRQTYGYAFLFAIFGLVFWFFGEAAVAIAFLVLGPVWVAWWPARARRIYRKRALALYREGQSPMLEGSHVLRLDDAGLVTTTPAAEARIPLTSVQRIVDTPEYVFIYVGAMRALIVPRRRVVRGDVNMFVQELQKRVTTDQPEK
jgi:YcxB-like protein